MELFFPSAFLALALAHFVALLSPGPDFFLLVGYAARYRLRGSAGLCLGIAAGNALYIVLVIIGWSALRQFTWLFTLSSFAGRCTCCGSARIWCAAAAGAGAE
jgi:threonine/homoserine/homoserine lactone efflux protein